MNFRTPIVRGFSALRVDRGVAGVFLPLVMMLLFCGGQIAAQDTLTSFRIGEKLTYTISFGKIADAGFAETWVVSRGKLSGHDAVEIHSKVKTIDVVSAAFFMFDESRTVFAAPDTGLPLYISKRTHDGPLPQEAISNYLTQPTANYDLLTLIYKARATGNVGTYPLSEGDQQYSALFEESGTAQVKTEIGTFDTTVAVLQTGFMAANGISTVTINFTADEARVPVMIRFKTPKGEFKATISAISLPEPPTPTATPTPTPVPQPAASPTPKPKATPLPYIENQPLIPELGFQIGELLDYRVTSGGKPVAIISLNARERKQFQKQDSLLLTATVTGVEQGSRDFNLGDAAKAQVDPETLAPKWMETKFNSPIVGLNQTLTFDKRTGEVSFGGPQPIDEPIGTHTLLSLIYAMRSFNLKLSKDRTNPVNDTRVAVFWESKAYVFTLRPADPEIITINGEKVSAQLITINTGNPQLDALNLKVWLSNADGRVPLRFSFGSYQADLIAQTSNLSK